MKRLLQALLLSLLLAVNGLVPHDEGIGRQHGGVTSVAQPVQVGSIAYYSNYSYPTGAGITAQPYLTNQTGRSSAEFSSGTTICVSAGSWMVAYVNVENDMGTELGNVNWVVYDTTNGSSASPNFTHLTAADQNDTTYSNSQYVFVSNSRYAAGCYVWALTDTLVFENGRQQFIGLTVVELQGVTNLTPYLGSAIDAVTGASSINVSATKTSGIGQPAIELYFVSNETATSSPIAPAAGGGATSLGTFLHFDSVNLYARLQWKRITGQTDAQTATQTSSGTDTYLGTLLIADGN